MHLDKQSALNDRNTLTERLIDSPYNPDIYLRRAICHERLGFPDLAVGDAYRALLLTDEVQDESGEYHKQATETIKALLESASDNNGDKKEHSGPDTEFDSMNGSGPLHNGFSGYRVKAQGEHGDDFLYEAVAKDCAFRTFVIITRSLSKCGCLNSAYNFASRGLKAFPGHTKLREFRELILESHRQSLPGQDQTEFDPKTDLPEQGSVRRELYPWNIHEPDRFSKSSLAFLNSEIRKVAPKCEIRDVSLPLLHEHAPKNPSIDPSTPPPTIQQLGIFATEDIDPNETVLHESSLLTANNRLHDPLCDACSSPLPPISPSSPLPSCPSCEDTIFCSEACLAAAQTLYHPAICEKPDFDILAKDPSPPAAANALYLLLLARTIALSETQQKHPLDLPETKYLWGDFIQPDKMYAHSALASQFSTARHLPFTFHDNILAPLHLLEKMDVDIFASLPRCDTWVLNTLFAKFRATASARLSTRDGKPEVCAVHPMWCLANHSCAPNVRWEWGGDIRFEARGAADVRDWKSMGAGRSGEGIRRGEEVLNHYCDVDLPVQQRREWAVGALGGMCVCERCLWEDGGKSNGDGDIPM